MRSMNETLSTNGNGLWSRTAKEVKCVGLEVPFQMDEDCNDVENGGNFGELRVYFDTNSWDVSTDGLIYTDRQFESELRDYLTRAGYDASDVSYSEQGMQGDNYVSCDVGRKFLATWK